MKRRIWILAVLGLLIVVAAAVWAVPARPPDGVIKPILPVPDPVTALLQQAAVESPQQYRNLWVFPVTVGRVPVYGDCLTVDEAFAARVLEVTEYAGGSVNRVVVLNRSSRPVFLMAGEMLGGARQDRIIGEDVLVPPRAKVDISVYCVEAHRWTGGQEFHTLGKVAAGPVRRVAETTGSQSDVWAGVSAQAEQFSVATPSAALREVQSDARVARERQPYVDALTGLPGKWPRANGVVVAVGREFLVADVFSSADLFRRLWPKLLESYVMDALSRQETVANLRLTPPSRQEAERFLGQAMNASSRQMPTPGMGRLIRLQGQVAGSALLVTLPSLLLGRPGEDYPTDRPVRAFEAVVHLDLFPAAVALPMLEERSGGLNLDIRRRAHGGGDVVY